MGVTMVHLIAVQSLPKGCPVMDGAVNRPVVDGFEGVAIRAYLAHPVKAIDAGQIAALCPKEFYSRDRGQGNRLNFFNEVAQYLLFMGTG